MTAKTATAIPAPRLPSLLGTLFLSAAALAAVVHASGPVRVEAQVLPGQIPPGFADDFRFARVGQPDFNDSDQVVFAGDVEDAQRTTNLRGIFVKDGEGIRKIALQGDPLPGGEGTFPRQARFTINNSERVVIAIPSLGILLHDGAGLEWLVKVGNNAPETEAEFAEVRSGPVSNSPISPLFNDSDEVLFHATLSDASEGVFLAAPGSLLKIVASGDAVPGSAAVFSSEDLSRATTLLKGQWVLLRLPFGLFRFSRKTGLQPIVVEGSGLVAGGATVTGIGGAQMNSLGEVAFVATDEEERDSVFLWSPAGAVPIVQFGDPIPGFPGNNPYGLRLVTLDDQRRLLVVVASGTIFGFYLWESGQFQKVVVEGDPTPLGGSFGLALSSPIGLGPFTSVRPMNDSLEFAFESRINGGDTSFATSLTLSGALTIFIWRNGILEPIVLDNENRPELGDRLISSLRPLSVNARGSLLLSGSLCCDRSNSVFIAKPASSQDAFLPFLAAGEDHLLRFGTRIDLFNHSLFPGLVETEVIDSRGQTIRLTARLLAAGQRWTFSIGPQVVDELTTGYVRLRVGGGAKVGAQALIQASSHLGLVSQTVVTSSVPTSDGTVLVEVSQNANTGIALTNPGSSDSEYLVRLKNSAGEDLWSGSVVLAAKQQQSLFVTELVPGLPVPFQGLLELRGDNRFLLAGIRQSDLQLSTLPVGGAGRVPERPRSFANLFPAIPPQDPSAEGTEALKQVLVADDGRIALRTDEAAIWLISGQESTLVLDRGTVLPEVGKRVVGRDPLVLLGFLADGSLLFRSRFEQIFIGGIPSGEGLFRFRDNTLEKVAVFGERLFDGSRPDVSDAVLSPDGTLLIPGRDVPEAAFFVFADDVFHRLQTASSLGVPWTALIASRIDFGDDRRIGLVSEQEDRLSLIHGDELRIVAQQGDVIDGRFEIRKIGNIKLTIRNRLIFTAFGARSIEPGVFESGLFVAHDQGVVPLFVSGDPAPGVTGAAIATVERRHLSLTTPRFRVNSSGTVVVAAEFAPAEGSTFRGSGWGFLRVGADLGKELILPTPENFPDGAPFSIRSNPQFQWTDEDQLVFEAPRMESALSRALFLWTPHELSVLAREGDPVSPLGSQASSLLESVRTLWAVHRDRVFFRARVRGEDTSGLYAAIPGKAHQYAIPHVVAGDFGQTHYETSLLLQNRDSESARVDVYLLSPEGQVVVAMERFRLEAGEVRTLILDPPEAFVGWARVEVTGGALAVFERFAVKAGEELVSEVTVPAVFQRQTGSWTGSDSFGDTNGGIAIANPYNAPIYVQVEVVIPGLRIERQSTLEIPAKGQRAVLQSELFPSCRCSGRIIRFRTDLPVPAISLRLDGIRIASQPIVH